MTDRRVTGGVGLAITAVHRSDFKLLQKELESVDANASDRLGWTVLHHAAFLGRARMVRFLCQRGDVDCSFQNNDGCTALHFACAHGYLEVAKTLLQFCDAAWYIRDHQGITPEQCIEDSAMLQELRGAREEYRRTALAAPRAVRVKSHMKFAWGVTRKALASQLLRMAIQILALMTLELFQDRIRETFQFLVLLLPLAQLTNLLYRFLYPLWYILHEVYSRIPIQLFKAFSNSVYKSLSTILTAIGTAIFSSETLQQLLLALSDASAVLLSLASTILSTLWQIFVPTNLLYLLWKGASEVVTVSLQVAWGVIQGLLPLDLLSPLWVIITDMMPHFLTAVLRAITEALQPKSIIANLLHPVVQVINRIFDWMMPDVPAKWFKELAHRLFGSFATSYEVALLILCMIVSLGLLFLLTWYILLSWLLHSSLVVENIVTSPLNLTVSPTTQQ